MSSGLVVLTAGPASAAEGTVKVAGYDTTDVPADPGDSANDPMVGCAVSIRWEGWAAGTTARVEFSLQRPTLETEYDLRVDPEPDDVTLATGWQTQTYGLSFARTGAGVAAESSQGYHVRVDVYTPSDDRQAKSKTIWVADECKAPTSDSGSDEEGSDPATGGDGSGQEDGPATGEDGPGTDDDASDGSGGGGSDTTPGGPGESGPGSGDDQTRGEITVTAKQPTWVEADCGVAPKVLVPTVAGVRYVVTDATPRPGQKVKVTAKAVKGYVLAPSTEHVWRHRFRPAPENCGPRPPAGDTTDGDGDTRHDSDTGSTPPKGGTGENGGSTTGGSGGTGAGGTTTGSDSSGHGGSQGGKGGKGGKVRAPEILGVEATAHQPRSGGASSDGVDLTGVTAVVSSSKPLSGGVAVPTAVDAGLGSSSPADGHSGLLGGLQLAAGGALLVAGGWGLRRRPRRG